MGMSKTKKWSSFTPNYMVPGGLVPVPILCWLGSLGRFKRILSNWSQPPICCNITGWDGQSTIVNEGFEAMLDWLEVLVLSFIPPTSLETNIMPLTSAPSVPISHWAGTNLAEQLSFVSGEKLLLRVFSEVDSKAFQSFFGRFLGHGALVIHVVERTMICFTCTSKEMKIT